MRFKSIIKILLSHIDLGIELSQNGAGFRFFPDPYRNWAKMEAYDNNNTKNS